MDFVRGLCIVNGIKIPFKLVCDNKSVVLYSNNNKSLTKLNHIGIKFLVVKESSEWTVVYWAYRNKLHSFGFVY